MCVVKLKKPDSYFERANSYMPGENVPQEVRTFLTTFFLTYRPSDTSEEHRFKNSLDEDATAIPAIKQYRDWLNQAFTQITS